MESHGIFHLIILFFSVKPESVEYDGIESIKGFRSSFGIDILGIQKEVEREKKSDSKQF